MIEIVDEYALLKAQIDEAETRIGVLRKILIETNAHTIKGTLHKVTVTPVVGRKSVDWKAIALKLGAKQDMVELYTTEGAATYRLNVYGL
jgi:hypothetical protein